MSGDPKLALNHCLDRRLERVLRHLAAAESELARFSGNDDGAARSLLNDLRYLRDRMADRRRVESGVRT